MRQQKDTSAAGFNLVEALVATMILSGAVLTFGAISTNALSSTRLHRHYEMAASVIDKQLNLIDYMGIDAFLQAGQTEGVVEDMEPAYQWTVTTEYQGTDDLYLVTITVTWLEGNRPYNVTAQTMLDGSGASAARAPTPTRTPTPTPEAGGSKRHEESREEYICGWRRAKGGCEQIAHRESTVRNPQSADPRFHAGGSPGGFDHQRLRGRDRRGRVERHRRQCHRPSTGRRRPRRRSDSRPT